MKTIILQRQGSSSTTRTNHGTLITPGVGTSCPGFYLELSECSPEFKNGPKSFRYDISKGDYRDADYVRKTGRLATECYASACALLSIEAGNALGESITIDPIIETYCQPNSPDVEFKRCEYRENGPQGPGIYSAEPESRDHLLASWNETDTPVLNPFADPESIPAIARWDFLLPLVMKNYPQEVACYSWRGDKARGIRDARVRCAWLLSEYRKYGHEKHRP